jgi:hypothetical protein
MPPWDGLDRSAIANFRGLAFDEGGAMTVTSTIRGGQLVRLLGAWQSTSRTVPDYLALADALRGLLTDGRLALGVRRPAERELAGTLAISRTTGCLL